MWQQQTQAKPEDWMKRVTMISTGKKKHAG